ncbi:MAG: tetratricopeptide repeat protein [Planctomycetes bacterium]|nr:tetratricopeptide repeat protein [Planctomycetota bacterium]
MKKTAAAKRYSISTGRIWLFRVLVLLVLPILVCLLLELVLRAAGMGYPTGIAVPCRIDGRDYYCNNIRFGWRFFPKEMSRQTDPFVFPREKERNGCRIFILGESAAQGAPDGAYSFGRMLEVMLRKSYPEGRFEVITAALPAINSHAVYPIVRDCLGYDPDLFVVYMGNNEVVGPYGAGTIFSPLVGHLGLIRAGVLAKSARLGQLIAGWAERLKNKARTPNWRGMEMFLGHRVGREDKALARVYRHFQANLEDILGRACGRRVPVVLCTVASNLRDCPPFASQHARTLSDEDRKKFEAFFASGKQAEDDKDFERALREYRTALRLDNDFAEVHFRMGQCYWQEARYEEARSSYLQALDYDALRFRADPQINKIIRDVGRKCRGRGVYFVDVPKVFSENSLHGVAGRELFYEHVHMTPQGNYLLAQAVFSELRRILPKSAQGESDNPVKLVSQAECERSLGYTKWEEYRIHETVLNGFIKRPPFTNQAYQSERLEYFRDRMGSLQRELTTDAKREIAAQYRQAIAESPSDWWLYWKCAEFLSEMDPDPAAALPYYRQVERRIPHFAQVHERLGVCEGKLGQLDRAIESCEKSVALDPYHSYTRFHLGYAYQLKGNTEKAAEQYRTAVRLAPENGPAWNNLGGILYSKGDVLEAIAIYRKALEHVHDFSDLNYNLAVLLQQQGNRPEAIQELEAGLQIDPNSMKIRRFLHAIVAQ